MTTQNERLAVLETLMSQSAKDIAELKDIMKTNSEQISVEIQSLKEQLNGLKIQRLFGGLAIAIAALIAGSPDKALLILKGLTV